MSWRRWRPRWSGRWRVPLDLALVNGIGQPSRPVSCRSCISPRQHVVGSAVVATHRPSICTGRAEQNWTMRVTARDNQGKVLTGTAMLETLRGRKARSAQPATLETESSKTAHKTQSTDSIRAKSLSPNLSCVDSGNSRVRAHTKITPVTSVLKGSSVEPIAVRCKMRLHFELVWLPEQIDVSGTRPADENRRGSIDDEGALPRHVISLTPTVWSDKPATRDLIARVVDWVDGNHLRGTNLGMLESR